MSSTSINIKMLKGILVIINGHSPIPNHKLANKMGVHPATVKNTVHKAKELLGLELEVSRKGYEGVKDPGVLNLNELLK